MMKTFILIITSCFIFSSVTGQQSLDFTITDTEGITHSLYEDYLNQGEIVVLNIFFVACPLCKPYNESFQQLYEELGEGTEGVEFFLLSNKIWDTNEEVADYKVEWGITCPGAGEDGGGYDATEPYRTGYFGPFYGTPTFVVIAPDGTTYHGIEGNSVAETMQAIKDKVNEVKLGAFSTEVNVDVESYYGYDLPSYKIMLRSGDNPETKYEVPSSFFYPSQNYPEVSNPELYIEIDTITTEHISTLDLVLMQRNFLGLVDFDFIQKIAADVNGDQLLAASDMLIMRKFILRLIPKLNIGKSFFAINDACRENFDDCLFNIPIDTNVDNFNVKFSVMQYGDVRK